MVTGNRQKTRAMHTGSKAWKAIRAGVLIRDSYTCAECGKYGDQVDHIDGDSHNNDMANLQVLCLRDHSAKTMREQNAGRGR
jgi:5-methylcytosine-specific restriction endonuclease McrA